MIIDVFIIRKGMRDFLLVDPETNNWDWTQNLDDATIYQTQEKAELDKLQKKLGTDAWVYQIPYSVTQQRKKKSTKKKPVKRSVKKKRK
jgi:hypothetical protein